MGVTLASLWGQFGISLGSVWGQFGYRLPTLRRLMVTLQSLWNHFGHIKARVQKTFNFPYIFQLFYKVYGWIVYHFRSLWGHFWRMKVTLEAL